MGDGIVGGGMGQQIIGDEVMKILGLAPGPKVGAILAVLLEEVIEEPKRNSRENLEARIKNLGKLSDKELQMLAKKAKETKEEFESGEEEKIKKQFYVK